MNEAGIAPNRSEFRDQVVTLTLEAWVTVFERMREKVSCFVYDAFYPQGWRAFMAFAEGRIREAGMSMAMVETGGGSGHAPARRS